MYNKFLIVASKEDEAGVNITTQLSQFRKNSLLKTLSKGKRFFDFYLIEDSILDENNLDFDKINQYDFIIFASKHKSDNGEKSLTIHAPGNWREADYGGEKGKVCKSSAQFQKQLFEKLKEQTEKYDLTKHYKVSLEATHHGPLILKPCVFIEIGPSEVEWKHRRAGFVVAKTISETIENFKINNYREVAIGVGGPHYCPGFTKLQAESNVAISHIIPQYIAPLTEEMIVEAWEKTEEDPDFAIIDWKGLSPAEERERVVNILEKNSYPWKKLKQIKR